MNAVGVDVGGTKIAAGVVSPEGKLLHEVRCPTANARERLLSTIAEAIAEVRRGYEVGGVCPAVPGPRKQGHERCQPRGYRGHTSQGGARWPHGITGDGRERRQRRGLGRVLARKGDKASVKVLKDTGTWLRIGLAIFVNIFDLEVIAIGGGVSEAGDLVLEPARRELRQRSHSPSRDLVEIREATLGAKSGMLGAAALARDEGEEYVLGVSAPR